MRQLSILVVEDEPLIAMLLCDILVEMGHSVCALESTEKGAVAAALQHRPEMMIVDDGLLQGSGISAIALRSSTTATTRSPAVMLSPS